jgi:hypothetical protein
MRKRPREAPAPIMPGPARNPADWRGLPDRLEVNDVLARSAARTWPPRGGARR